MNSQQGFVRHAYAPEPGTKGKKSLCMIATGMSVPDTILTNQSIQETLNPDISPEWVADTLGIHERRIAGDGIFTVDLAANACLDALANADIDPASIDLLIFSSSTPDYKVPSSASIVKDRVNLPNANAFDVSAACAGFLLAVTIADQMLQAGTARRALVVASEVYSRFTDWTQRDCVFFGDGAGAVVLELQPSQQSSEVRFCSEYITDSKALDAVELKTDDTYYSIDAQKVFMAATRNIPICIEKVLRQQGLTAEDIDVVVPHQASKFLLRALARMVNVPFSKFVTIMDKYGNTGAATIPMALHNALKSGRVKPGDRVLFTVAAGGFTVGAAVCDWR